MSLIVILQGSMNINKSHSHPRLAGVFTKSQNRREEVIVVALNRSQVQVGTFFFTDNLV